MPLKCRPHMEPSGVPCIRPPMPMGPERPRLPVMTVNGERPDAKGNVKVDLSGIEELNGKVARLGDAVSEENQRAVGAENELSGRIAAETSRAQTAEQGLRADVSSAQSAIADRYTKSETDAKIAEAVPADYDEVKGRVAAIEAKVPAQATAQNQLADKAFVNSSIATETATFRGTFNLVTDLQLPLDATHIQVANAIRVALVTAGTDSDDNDYVYVQIPQDLEHTDAMKHVDRYKCTVVGSSKTWAYEWTLNNSSFTAEQWAAINSGITSGGVAKLGALPTAEALAQALAGKMSSTATGADIPVDATQGAQTISAALAGKASTADATLTPVYDGNGKKFSDWVCVPATYEGNPITIVETPSEEAGMSNYTPYSNGAAIGRTGTAAEDILSLRWRQGAASLIDLTATRTANKFLGYQLGEQDDKPLQPAGDYVPTTRTVNSKALSSDVTLTGADIAVSGTDATKIDAALAGKLDKSGGMMTPTFVSGRIPSGKVVFGMDAAGPYIGIAYGQNVVILRPSEVSLNDRNVALAASPATAGNLAALDANGNPTDSGIAKDDVESLIFSQCYPDGNVKSAAEFTQGIKYDAPNTANRTITVKPFCETGTAANDNSSLVGRVVIPPFVDEQGNGCVSDDGTRFKVVGVSGGSGIDYSANLTDIIAPNTVTTIGGEAFAGCTTLTSVSLPAATTVGSYAFNYCTALTSVSLPAATTIGGYAFAGCNALASVSLPVATDIGSGAFNYCTALTSVSLPAATSIVSGAFGYCNALTSVSLPAATSIGSGAFNYCTALTSVSLPVATDIGSGAFSYCTALTSVSLPAATSIGSGAFYNCTALASVDFGDTPRSSVPTLGSSAFNDVPTSCKIIVPDSQYDAWTAASGWSELVTAGYKFLRHSEWEYARKYEVDKKADKPATFTSGNLAALDASGNPTDSGKKATDFAPLASPAFTGTPTAPTPTAGDNSTKVATTAFVQGAVGAIPYSLGTPIVIDSASSGTVEGETVYYGAAILDNRTANIVQVTAATALDELRIWFPEATSGKARDFGLRVEIGTGSAALAAPALVLIEPYGETIKIENADGTIPELADGTAAAKGVTLLYFSETSPGKFLVKGEEVKEVA